MNAPGVNEVTRAKPAASYLSNMNFPLPTFDENTGVNPGVPPEAAK
jgi:hypothetical protein